jgi:hypothetical protein
LGMCSQKKVKIFYILAFSALIGVLCGCEAMDNILASAEAYKINARIDGVPLEDCSYVKSTDSINLSFEDRVSNDPDVSTLVVFLKNSAGDVAGWKVIYTIDPSAAKKEAALKENENKTNEKPIEKKAFVFNENGDELNIPVVNLDGELPFFPIPESLSVGNYTLTLQVMNGKEALQKTEKNIYYIGRTAFSYEGINVYLPGAGDTPHIVPKDSVVMLEVNLNFDPRLNPYIIWYNGKNKISEGKFSDGAGFIFWKSPEQNGFFSLCAEVFPTEKGDDLAGYKKEISLLVSSNVNNIHLISSNIEQLKHWYTMEGNLNDLKNIASDGNALKSGTKNKLKWMGKDGTYGVATGYNNILELPKMTVLHKDTETWQALFRFKPLNNGVILSANFASSNDAAMFLSIEGKDLVLTLTSPQKKVLQTVRLTTESDELPGNIEDLPFVTAGIKFSINSNMLSAQINVTGNLRPVELATRPIMLETKIEDKFSITLGFTDDSSLAELKNAGDKPESSAEQTNAKILSGYNALWDEFALYYMPPINILDTAFKPVTREDQPIMIAKR